MKRSAAPKRRTPIRRRKFTKADPCSAPPVLIYETMELRCLGCGVTVKADRDELFPEIKHAPRKSKFGVRIDAEGKDRRTYQGIQYHSMKEAKYAAGLDMRKRAVGAFQIKGWRRQVPVKLEVNGMLVATLIVDFEVEHMDGRRELVETKGFETDTWRIKHTLSRALGIPITVVR